MKKRKFRKNEIIKKVLIAAGITVGLGASIVMPGLPIAIGAIMKALEEEKWSPSRKQVRHSLRSLAKKKIVSLKEVNGELLVTFREERKELLLRYKIDELRIKNPKRWDGKWRMVIFDIPEKKRLARDVLRDKLKELGFYCLQKSVFVYPYDCQREIELIKRVYEIEPYVYFLLVEALDCEKKLEKIFEL